MFYNLKYSIVSGWLRLPDTLLQRPIINSLPSAVPDLSMLYHTICLVTSKWVDFASSWCIASSASVFCCSNLFLSFSHDCLASLYSRYNIPCDDIQTYMLIPSLLLCVERGVSYSNISMQYKVLTEYFNFCIMKMEMFIVITYSTRYMYILE